MNDTGPIVVLGGTGKTGRRVADRLTRLGVPVRLGSRRGDPPFDWEDPGTWERALRGGSAAYVSYYPDLAVPGAPEAIEALTRLALDAGLRRLVLLSGRGEHEAQRAEEVVRSAMIDSTIVRCSWFAQNFSEGQFADQIAQGALALPVDAVREPFVDADDIADVAVAALTQDGHAGRLYELTGPQPITFAEAVDEIATATGRPIRFTPVSLERFAAAMSDAGVEPATIAFLKYLFSEVLDGRNSATHPGVREALGREAGRFRAYAERTAAGGGFGETT